MKSPSLHTDNEDDFDWEAAVREIDTACEIASKPRAPTSNTIPIGKKRQSTLDRFVDSFTKRKKSCIRMNPNVDCVGLDNPAAEGGESAVEIDLEAAKTWIYPVNVPLRDYQFSIAKVALFSNTLVALPTGLGKTLIAAVVMYNYFRWFPEGKIIFTAPSRPLVMQQIEACHNIVGIPQEWAIDMTGQMSPLKRLSCWKTKRVFFVTPQVLEKDIKSGICLVKQIVCLVIDEAHRALGNYSYCVAVRELMTGPVQFRILALTATPGSKQQTIQNVIDNLCISTLEYRNEADCDVSPYVHNRTLELIEVEMGTDATRINNLLLEAIQPFVTRLSSCGVLYNRDAAMLSPCELLNLRDQFRQAPPSRLDQTKNKEVEGYFGVLLSLYHIRKLLTSHGIRPAYEMLDEKLRSSGPLAWFGNRNESINQVKLLMQQSLSHGAPNPKLVKLIEILKEHFKAKDPKDSRVIIFSNFRGSVKDIMDSLSSIGDLVKATKFIGQSSGKVLKGQTQKVQQAVLQKFRTGGYNVIVATSIGEEGLDIMEVDLVICFDANVSPLRMVQRMGRTGRKHDGRVVVLACEGSEVKSYRKKQASSKAIRKHMHNGGIKSFAFHSSPRMVPHICKPQAQFVELSIEQFIPRGKKLKDDSMHRSPVSGKLLDEERDLIRKYFHQVRENVWRPSLISFPSFQTFPSGVHEVRHSFRTTTMLIDTMQHLQGLELSNANKGASMMEVDAPHQSPEVAVAAVDNFQESIIEEKVSIIEELEAPFNETLEAKYMLQTLSNPIQKFSHRLLFGDNFVTVDSIGRVLIASVPCLPHKKSAVSKVIPLDDNREMFANTVNGASSFKETAVHCGKPISQGKDVVEAQVVVEKKFFETDGILASNSQRYDVQREDGVYKFVLETLVCKQKLVKQEYSVAEAAANAENVLGSAVLIESDGALNNMELSPRLTHFMEEGIVPESPIVNHGHLCNEGNVMSLTVTPILDRKGSLSKLQSTSALVEEQLLVVGSCSLKDKLHGQPYAAHNIVKICGVSSEETKGGDKCELVKVQNGHCEGSSKRSMLYSPINQDIRTPVANSVNNSSSENWQLNSGEASKSSHPAPKYKRLRKYGDVAKILSYQTSKEKDNCSPPNTSDPIMRNGFDPIKRKKGKREKAKKLVNCDFFIEEEAEVSQDAEVSEDEEDGEYEDQYEDSFIDDRAHPTEVSTASTDVETCLDMMAFYRRSLLTQSPAECLPSCLATPHEESTVETESCSSEKVDHNLQTPQNGLQLTTHQMGLERTTEVCEGRFSSIESRKRKLSFQRNNGFMAPAKFQLEDASELEHSARVLQQQPSGSTDPGTNLLCDDDDFYQCLDLDAVEEQATMLLKNRCGLKIPSNSAQINENFDMDLICSPSFDLGV